MGEYKIVLSFEEEKALLTDMISIQEWIENAIKNKARQCIDVICAEFSEKQLNKLTFEEKLSIVRAAPVKSAAERSRI